MNKLIIISEVYKSLQKLKEKEIPDSLLKKLHSIYKPPICKKTLLDIEDLERRRSEWTVPEGTMSVSNSDIALSRLAYLVSENPQYLSHPSTWKRENCDAPITCLEEAVLRKRLENRDLDFLDILRIVQLEKQHELGKNMLDTNPDELVKDPHSGEQDGKNMLIELFGSEPSPLDLASHIQIDSLLFILSKVPQADIKEYQKDKENLWAILWEKEIFPYLNKSTIYKYSPPDALSERDLKIVEFIEKGTGSIIERIEKIDNVDYQTYVREVKRLQDLAESLNTQLLSLGHVPPILTKEPGTTIYTPPATSQASAQFTGLSLSAPDKNDYWDD